MLERLSRLAVARWRIVLALTALFCLYGWRCFDGLPIEAFPDVTDPRVEVVGTYPGQAAEEVERRVTVELERVLAGTPKLLDLRSVSVFGLSLVTLTFEEGTTDFELRTNVAERLRDAVLPEGAAAQMGPQSTPVGQIYRYTLRGPLGLKDLRAIQDFVVERRLRAVPGVADVVTFGGFERNYQVRVDPIRLTAAGISVDDVHAAIARANENSGGGYSGIGSQEFVVRGMGVIRDPKELGDIVLDTRGSVPIHIRDVADVIEGSTPRRGAVGRGHADDVVEGIVLLRRKAHPSLVLAAVQERIEELNRTVLPPGVKIDTFYDRTTLMRATLATVRRNLLEGVSLVLLVVWLFLGSLRAVVAVAAVVPISMLSAFIGLTWLGLPANLISLGAIDFGILVDGAIVVLEATLHLFHTRSHGGRLGPAETAGVIAEAAASVVRPVVFAMAIIIVALVPIFFLERVEGRIFAPMAYTYAFALGGALVSAIVVVPALERLLFRGRFRTAEPAWLVGVRWAYLKLLAGCDTVRWLILPAAAAGCVALGWYASGIGTEFLPELNEGGFYVTSIFPSTISLDETRHQVAIMRESILHTPEVLDVMSHVGRPENATQAEGPNNAEFFITLTPERTWGKGRTRQAVEAELRRSLAVIPGVQHNFSQPITDRVFETISGIIGQVVLKIRGTDLERMTELAEQAKERLAAVPGVVDLSIYQAGDVPTQRIELNRDALSRRGLAVHDIQNSIRIVLGSEKATDIWQGERRYPVTIRLPNEARANMDILGHMFVGSPEKRITLAEVASIGQVQGRAAIWRQDFARFVAVKFNVRGRDLGSTVKDAQAAVAAIDMPAGIHPTWSGEFQNQERAMRRLGVTVPMALCVIVGVLFMNFGRWPPTIVILLLLPFAALGAVAGLRLMHVNFSVSSAVGCIALLGQVVLSGVIECTQYLRALAVTRDRRQALLLGAREAFRPVMLTTTLALLGLVPAALAHGMGSETQRPFAIAIVSGLVASLPAVTLVAPILCSMVVRRADDDPAADPV
jgi:cobalt-zinc-cadmium resistance protein CzcA